MGLTNFTERLVKQLALFEQQSASLETLKDRELSRAVDAVRERFGHDAIAPGRKR